MSETNPRQDVSLVTWEFETGVILGRTPSVGGGVGLIDSYVEGGRLQCSLPPLLRQFSSRAACERTMLMFDALNSSFALLYCPYSVQPGPSQSDAKYQK
jgi:hypothetical protein